MSAKICSLLFSCLLFLAGCALPQHQSLRKVAVGMDKSEVLDLVGNPARTERVHNQDRWVYHDEQMDNTSDQKRTKMTYIYFAEGKVTYVGPEAEPTAKNQNSNGGYKKITEPESD